jgi:hypothetical protein
MKITNLLNGMVVFMLFIGISCGSRTKPVAGHEDFPREMVEFVP